MILLDDVVHVLTRPALASLWQEVVLLQVTDGSDVSGILIDIDYSWGGDVGSAQDFAGETLGCSCAAGLVQEEIECLTSGINNSIQIHPFAFNFDLRFVNAP